jgi:hypothetical protein
MTKRTLPLEEALSDLYQQVEPDAAFTRRLENELLAHASSTDQRQPSTSGINPGLRAAGWIAAGVLVLVLFAWAINNLIARPTPGSEPAAATSQLENPIPPTSSPEPTLLLTTRNPLIYTVKSGDTLESISKESGIPVEIIMALNNLDEETLFVPGTEIIIGFSSPTQTPTQKSQMVEPISISSSSEEIRQCLLSSEATWDTLWVNALLTTKAKGAQHVDREQVWLQKGASRWLAGGINEDPSLLWIQNSDGSALADLESGEIQPFELSSRIPSQLEDLLIPTRFASRGGEFRTFNIETVADHEAVAVEWRDDERRLIDRFWIEAERCVILRWVHLPQEYAEASGEILPVEVAITAIVFDEQFNTGLFALESSLSLDFVEEFDAP